MINSRNFYVILLAIISLNIVNQCCGSFDNSWIKGPTREKKFNHQASKYNQSQVHKSTRRKQNADIDISKTSHQQISRSRTRSFEPSLDPHKLISSINKNHKQIHGIKNNNETSKGIDFLFGGSRESQNLQNIGKSQDMQFIFFGTKWCGAGSIAKSKRDIGYFSLTDSCCRDHDLCPEGFLAAKESRFGLKNTGKFTRSNCECDKRFYDCLKNVDSLVSNQLGMIYFNILGPQCYIEDYPHDCEHSVKGRCVKYGKDSVKEKIYQWIDNKWY